MGEISYEYVQRVLSLSSFKNYKYLNFLTFPNDQLVDAVGVSVSVMPEQVTLFTFNASSQDLLTNLLLMKKKRLNVEISEEAHKCLSIYQATNGFKNKDEALDDFLQKARNKEWK